MGDTGLEPFPEKLSEVTVNKGGNNISTGTPKPEEVHNPVHKSVICSELQQIIEVWPSLPEHIKKNYYNTYSNVNSRAKLESVTS